MLTEQRYEIILGLLREKNSVTVTELKDILNASESTVRRDITALYKAGKLTRVFWRRSGTGAYSQLDVLIDASGSQMSRQGDVALQAI